MRISLALFFAFIFILLSMMNGFAQDSEPPYEEIIRVTALSSVNVRDEASTHNPAIATLQAGETVTVLEQIPEGEAVSGNTLWYRVALNDVDEGYVWSGAVSDPSTERRCLRYIEPSSDETWILDRQNPSLMAYNLEDQALRGGQSNEQLVLWTVLVTVQELRSELGISNQLTTEPIVDEVTCHSVGAVVQQGSFRYIAVRETQDSADIQFTNERYTANIRHASEEEIAQIQAIAGEIERAEIDQAEHLLIENQLYLGEKITFVGVIPGTRSSTPYQRGITRIYLLSPDGSILTDLTNQAVEDQGSETYPAWSPDGRTVSFLTERRQAYMGTTLWETFAFFDLVNRVERVIRRQDRYWLVGSTWSPDGNQLAVVRMFVREGQSWPSGDIGIIPHSFQRLGLDTVDILTDTFQPQDGDGVRGYTISSPRWSPNGEALAFIFPESDGMYWGVYYYSFGDSTFHRVGDGEIIQWSPDSTHILIANLTEAPNQSYDAQYYIAPLDGADPQYLLDNPMPFKLGCEPQWSPVEDEIAYCSQSDGEDIGSLFIYNIEAQISRRLTADLDVRGIAWSPDGLQLAFVGIEPDSDAEYQAMYVIDTEGRNRRLIADGIDYVSNLMWLPALDN